jgi:hypothetical protein
MRAILEVRDDSDRQRLLRRLDWPAGNFDDICAGGTIDTFPWSQPLPILEVVRITNHTDGITLTVAYVQVPVQELFTHGPAGQL